MDNSECDATQADKLLLEVQSNLVPPSQEQKGEDGGSRFLQNAGLQDHMTSCTTELRQNQHKQNHQLPMSTVKQLSILIIQAVNNS
jgi:hypothetical protein